MSRAVYTFIISSVFFLSSVASNLPRAREATLIESSSPTEVMIRATGLGIDEKHRKPKAAILDKSANTDAARTAVWYVLHGGSDPLLQTDEEKIAFSRIESEFFALDNIRQFISWEADYYDKRLRTDGGKTLKIEKTFKINKKLLTDYLVNKSVLAAVSAVSQTVGNPTIMVIPEPVGDTAPLDLLEQDPDIKKAAEVIESYLTAKQYPVIVPEQQQVLQELSTTQYALAGSEDDYSYLLALSIGSDVYISFNIAIESRNIGTTTAKKAVVGCRAYETTTGRLLGTDTGYSQERAATTAVLIEEAMNNAVDKVISRISNYWKSDLKQGVQYKIILSISTDFDKEQSEEIIFAAGDVFRKIVPAVKNTLFPTTPMISLSGSIQ